MVLTLTLKRVDKHLISVESLHLHHLKLALELGLTFGLLLGASDKQLLAVDVLSVQILDGRFGLLGRLEADKSVAFAFAIIAGHHLKNGDEFEFEALSLIINI